MRTLTIEDTGIGMNMEDMEENLGTIAKSGSLAFKQQMSQTDSESKVIDRHNRTVRGRLLLCLHEVSRVTVISRKVWWRKGLQMGFRRRWRLHHRGMEREHEGTTIILEIKHNADETDYDQYLQDYRIRSLVKKYNSDFIKYPVKMGEETINSMVPLWKKNKSEITDEDYENFYNEKHFGFDKSLKSIYYSVDGAELHIHTLYTWQSAVWLHSKDFERGLELYSNNVMIMQKCQDLLPEYFGFVQGVVDSQGLVAQHIKRAASTTIWTASVHIQED